MIASIVSNIRYHDSTIYIYSVTGSDNIVITGNQVSRNFTIQINDEIVLDPRAYDGVVFDMLSGTDSFAFRQNSTHGGQPISQFYSSTKPCIFHDGCSVPTLHNKLFTYNLISNVYADVYMKTEIDSFIANTNTSNYYNKHGIGYIDNELSTLILNTCNNMK